MRYEDQRCGAVRNRIDRQLGLGVAALFPEFTIAEESGATVLRGEPPDQAALHGVVARTRDLGLILVSLTRVQDGPVPARERL